MQNTLSEKLEKQTTKTPILFFADVDGTLFTAGWQLITAPWYNLQTSHILQKNNIPIILVTGRPFWNTFIDYEIFLHGITCIDAVILAGGTGILYKKTDGTYEKDMAWEKQLAQTSWNAKEMYKTIQKYFADHNLHFKMQIDTPYLIRIFTIGIPIQQLQKLMSDLQTIWKDSIEIITTEKLLRENSLEIFSCNILITPKNIGKGTAVQYLLEKYANQPHAFIFGDASIDVPMLTIPEHPKQYALSQYGVHLTPLAKKVLQEKTKTNKNLHIIDKEGPQAILQVVKEKIPRPAGFSPAQNSKLRLIFKPFEKLLDSILDKNLSPNDISFLGLQKVQQGIVFTQKKNILEKIKGIGLYISGILIDGLDGIRARQTQTFAESGQLVDAFCDRAKEFYQVYERAKQRLSVIPAKAGIYTNKDQTFLTAISCILPSLARAQAELFGITVPEKDAKGGSMFDRTRLLFLSFFYQTFGFYKKSYDLDKKIYHANIATFENRLNILRHCEPRLNRGEAIPLIKNSSLNTLQRKALERFFLLVILLQEENDIIEKSLSSHPQILKQYKTEIEKIIKEYAKLNVNELRKKWDIKNYDLILSKYISLK